MRQNLARYSHILRTLIPLLALLLLCLTAFYVYVVSRSVLNVVMREELERELAAVNSDIGELEEVYLVLKNSIEASQVVELGLTPVASKSYVTRHSLRDRALTLVP